MMGMGLNGFHWDDVGGSFGSCDISFDVRWIIVGYIYIWHFGL